MGNSSKRVFQEEQKDGVIAGGTCRSREDFFKRKILWFIYMLMGII